MTKCTSKVVVFPACKQRKVEAEFSGGAVTSDGGGLLLRAADKRTGLTQAVAGVLDDQRVRGRCDHSLVNMIRQRVYGIALGYEDLNDHDHLRRDPGFQTVIDRNDSLASASTLCRFENAASRQACLAIHDVIVDKFLKSFKRAPTALVLDFDATDDRVHGNQNGKFFNAFYDSYCFLPLYVFCGDELLVSYLRPSNRDAARHTGAILKLLVDKIRARFPKVRIILRGDSGFCRPLVLAWCDRHDVDYAVGFAKNSKLINRSGKLIRKAERLYNKTSEKQRLFSEFTYTARTWRRSRRVVIKAEHSALGSNPRFVVTSLKLDPQKLYEDVYCARGEMENRIKEQQLALFADRTSCHDWWANQFRLMLSSLAYVLLNTVRRVGLKGTEFAQAQVDTIRLRLLKIGAVVTRNSRRVRFLLASAYPFKDIFQLVAGRLAPT